MAKDFDGDPIADGDFCDVIKGSHKGKKGIVEDSKLSLTGAETVTVRTEKNERFKTLAKNLRKSKK